MKQYRRFLIETDIAYYRIDKYNLHPLLYMPDPNISLRTYRSNYRHLLHIVKSRNELIILIILNTTKFLKMLWNSHKQFCEELTNINPRISVLGRYTKATDPIEVKCNVCGKIWSPKAYSLLQGKGCHA